MAFVIIMFAPFVLLFIISNLIDKNNQKKMRNGQLSKKQMDRVINKTKKVEKQNDTIKQIETNGFIRYFKMKNMTDTQKEQLRKHETIVKTMIIVSNSYSQQKFGSSAMRGAIGNALLGPVGLVSGALSGKNKITNETTFLIEYEDGHRETKIVDNNSSEFEKLCKYLEM